MVRWMRGRVGRRELIAELEGETEKLRGEDEELRRNNEGLEKDNKRLERDNKRLERNNERLEKEKEKLREEAERLRKELEMARRGGKRQAVPFSKGNPKSKPKRPGRKAGAGYGLKGHRAAPSRIDEEIEVPLPGTMSAVRGKL